MNGGARVTCVDFAWTTVKVLAAILGFGLNIAGLLGWVERKQSAVMQDRIGANRADIFGITILGLFHPIADAIKMLTKEDFQAKGVHKPLHGLAPMISLGCGMFCLAALPYGGTRHGLRPRSGICSRSPAPWAFRSCWECWPSACTAS